MHITTSLITGLPVNFRQPTRPAHSRRDPNVDTVSYLMMTGDKPLPSQFTP